MKSGAMKSGAIGVYCEKRLMAGEGSGYMMSGESGESGDGGRQTLLGVVWVNEKEEAGGVGAG
jgi:hypothetical protein